MILDDIRLEPAADPAWVRLSAALIPESGEANRQDLWFEVPASLRDEVDTSGTPWLLAALPMVHGSGERLHIRATVDEALLRHVHELLDTWEVWHPSKDRIPIEVEGVTTSRATATARVGMFFSGGVDSFFTLLRHLAPGPELREPVEDLLLLWGFDVPPDAEDAFRNIADSATEVAAGFGKSLTIIRTNARYVLPAGVSWTRLAHGPIMGAAGLALGSRYKKLLIASSSTYRWLDAWGTHPLTDPLLGTARTAFANDGARDRLQKIGLVAKCDLAMRHLRVCTRPPFDENCGRCPKCLRTMLGLMSIGALEQCPAFPTLDLGHVRQLNLSGTFGGRMYRRMWGSAWRAGDKDLAKALASAIRRSTWLWLATGALHQVSPSLARALAPRLSRLFGLVPELGPAWPTEGASRETRFPSAGDRSIL